MQQIEYYCRYKQILKVNFEAIKNGKALAYTLGIHGVLLLLFFFVRYKSVALPQPPAEELIALEAVALGTDLDGMGIEPPEMIMDMPAPPNTPSVADASSSSKESGEESNFAEEASNDELHDDVSSTVHTSSAPVLRQSGNPNQTARNNLNRNTNNDRRQNERVVRRNTSPRNNNTSTSTNTRNTATQQPQAKYTYDGAQGTGGNSADQNAAGASSRGNGSGQGLMGRPGGDPNSFSFTGGITGRKIVARPDPGAEFKNGGTVRIKVWVDKEGNILRYNILSATNANIRAIAEQKIKGVRFDKKPDAASEQSGTLIFNFKAGTGR